ncbi:hypothetical protein CDAR_5731 [Caerostris darwini]|uniref:Uncharacterized protein n=1 Tax=Caerostris darwini TaxID=1538125 RepID=A0AAV4VIA8_9ARAC|nr:hypothetical protein CDAR_5731 [Caerostris darwini]
MEIHGENQNHHKNVFCISYLVQIQIQLAWGRGETCSFAAHRLQSKPQSVTCGEIVLQQKCATQSKDPQLYNLYTLVKKFVELLLTLRNSLMDGCMLKNAPLPMCETCETPGMCHSLHTSWSGFALNPRIKSLRMHPLDSLLL